MFMVDLKGEAIYFQVENKPVKISVPPTSPEEFRYTEVNRRRTDEQMMAFYEKDVRAKWRLMKEYLKLQLELVERHVTSMEHAFMSYFLLKTGKTLGEEWVPRLKNQTADFLRLPDSKPEEEN